MKYLSTSVLSIKENIKDNIRKIDSLNTDYIHLDIYKQQETGGIRSLP